MGQVKTLDEIKTMIRARTGKRNVFRRTKMADVEPVLQRLTDKDPERWARSGRASPPATKTPALSASAAGKSAKRWTRT